MMETEPSNPTDTPAAVELICPICQREKIAYQWVCHSCFRRLPHNFRKAFSTLKLQCLWWLREHPP
jgi:hypothetical protein